MKATRRVTRGTLAAAVLGLSCALVTSALIARQQALAEEGPSEITHAEFAGEIRPARETIQTAPAAVLITRVLASPGDRVEEGQVLIEVDDSQSRAAVSAAELTVLAVTRRVEHLRESAASIEQSVAGLAASLTDANRRLAVARQQVDQMPVRQWKDSPERAGAAYEQAAIHHRRVEELWHKGLVARQDLDNAQIALRIASNDRDTAQQAAAAAAELLVTHQEQARLQAQLTLVEQRRERTLKTVELQNAELDLARAHADLALAKRRLTETVIRATVAGTVVEVTARPGDRLPHGAMLLRTAQLDRLVALIDVPPRLVNEFARGLAAKVLPAIQSSPLDGRVRSISPMPDGSGTHLVEIEFVNPKELLLVGQTAQVVFP